MLGQAAFPTGSGRAMARPARAAIGPPDYCRLAEATMLPAAQSRQEVTHGGAWPWVHLPGLWGGLQERGQT